MEGLGVLLDRQQFNDGRKNSRLVAGGGDNHLHILG